MAISSSQGAECTAGASVTTAGRGRMAVRCSQLAAAARARPVADEVVRLRQRTTRPQVALLKHVSTLVWRPICMSGFARFAAQQSALGGPSA